MNPIVKSEINYCVDLVLSLSHIYTYTHIGEKSGFYMLDLGDKYEAWVHLGGSNYYLSRDGKFEKEYIKDMEHYYFDFREDVVAALKKYRSKEEEW